MARQPAVVRSRLEQPPTDAGGADMWRNAHHRGFTLVELMVTIAIAVILLSVAVPSFRGYFAKKKVEGTIAELVTDIQFARSEAVSRNVNMRMTFGSNCYVIHVWNAAASCTSAPSSTVLRTVVVDDTTSVVLSTLNSLTYIEFDSVRGLATSDSTVTTLASVSVKTGPSISSPVQLRATMTPFGRVQVCTTNSTAGYATCT
jgi:prepilin-type N-terminal cleavage/methylation domain-containing protein